MKQTTEQPLDTIQTHDDDECVAVHQYKYEQRTTERQQKLEQQYSRGNKSLKRRALSDASTIKLRNDKLGLMAEHVGKGYGKYYLGPQPMT